MEYPFRFVKIETYAELCGVSKVTAYAWLKANKINISGLCEPNLIDLVEYPPCKKVREFDPLPEKKDTLPDWVYEPTVNDLSKIGIK